MNKFNRFSSFSDLKEAVECARDFAAVEARRCSPWVWSRGTFLATSDARGQCRPAPEAEAWQWNGTKREVEKLIDDVLARYPEVTEVYIAGGFDGGQRIEDKEDGNYDPWVSSWNVTVWSRDAKPVAVDPDGETVNDEVRDHDSGEDFEQ